MLWVGSKRREGVTALGLQVVFEDLGLKTSNMRTCCSGPNTK